MVSLLPRLDSVDAVAWCSLPQWPPPAWRNSVRLSLGQSWRQAPDTAFQAGTAWLAVTATAFIILTELHDVDIFTRGQKHNDPLWELGDVFEVFIRHTDRPEYHEFHVAPNGVTLDLRYPRLYAPRTAGVAQYMLAEPHFTARTAVLAHAGRWRAVVEIPVGGLVPPTGCRTESVWQISLCRYDAGPGRDPVYSSTSPHQIADFHQAGDWPCFRVPAFCSGASS